MNSQYRHFLSTTGVMIWRHMTWRPAEPSLHVGRIAIADGHIPPQAGHLDLIAAHGDDPPPRPSRPTDATGRPGGAQLGGSDRWARRSGAATVDCTFGHPPITKLELRN
ncbi:hypothetical protein [Microtetraspora malaysiensis]|uniref:hypothetical protein n=1 Tax=Microtetraspora malaysiensis TaxID=161358 RepID=UPI003D9007CB